MINALMSPVFDGESRDSLELANVVRDQCGAEGQRMSGNQQIKRANHLTNGFQTRSQPTIESRRRNIELQY